MSNDDKENTNLTDYSKIILPMIRKIMPSMIASQIVGVQPMSNIRAPVTQITQEEIDGKMWYHIMCNDEVRQWINDTIDKSQFTDSTNDFQNKFVVSEEAMMMLKLKWS